VAREGRFRLGKLGRFLLDDEMTRVNFDFTRDVCYQAAAHLDASLQEGRPAGLQELGPWATLYEGLSTMPEPARASWHAFDHFYSDRAFPAACRELAAAAPTRCSTSAATPGKWAQYCLERLPAAAGRTGRPAAATGPRAGTARRSGLSARAQSHPVDLLDEGTPLPTGYDLIWMSQFLDCFSDDEVVAILRKAAAALPPNGRIWILELFWDRQRFEAAAFSLQQTSLYFSCVANGNSQMYDSAVFLALVEKAGLTVTRMTDGIGGYHTLLECRAAILTAGSRLTEMSVLGISASTVVHASGHGVRLCGIRLRGRPHRTAAKRPGLVRPAVLDRRPPGSTMPLAGARWALGLPQPPLGLAGPAGCVVPQCRRCTLRATAHIASA
jgi:hypothetical protein